MRAWILGLHAQPGTEVRKRVFDLSQPVLYPPAPHRHNWKASLYSRVSKTHSPWARFSPQSPLIWPWCCPWVSQFTHVARIGLAPHVCPQTNTCNTGSSWLRICGACGSPGLAGMGTGSGMLGVGGAGPWVPHMPNPAPTLAGRAWLVSQTLAGCIWLASKQSEQALDLAWRREGGPWAWYSLQVWMCWTPLL